MIKKLQLPLRGRPKHRGQLGRGGRVVHNMGWYTEYKDTFKSMVLQAKFQPPSDIFGIIFDYHFKKMPGKKSDLDNLSGLSMDCLVESGVISDDNWGILPLITAHARENETDNIVMYFTQLDTEYVYVLKNFVFDY